ncbi:nucleotidyltransferase domain-containing protein [Synechococcus sp. ATX 2A4]|uniref:nucleotidyltransferase domain-containing protein n=1 Tax=Synechococcus sp. ATX 2A4 TaxID=2823727 RepID=UPI0020CDF91E|nr:nucleotidyltransferase domain-containing protein [Synechococcus sp. ATX 2A4]
MFGSYGRGTAGVGSDLDLLLVDAVAVGPQCGRLVLSPLTSPPSSSAPRPSPPVAAR